MRRFFNGLWDRTIGRLAKLSLSEWVTLLYVVLSMLYWGTTLCAVLCSLIGKTDVASDCNWVLNKCPNGTGTFLLFGLMYFISLALDRILRWWRK